MAACAGGCSLRCPTQRQLGPRVGCLPRAALAIVESEPQARSDSVLSALFAQGSLGGEVTFTTAMHGRAFAYNPATLKLAMCAPSNPNLSRTEPLHQALQTALST
eukprot:3182460-Pleurochrysis_carterae.AAC.1